MSFKKLQELHYTHEYVINIMVVLIIFPVILQTVINVIMLSIGGQNEDKSSRTHHWLWHYTHFIIIYYPFHRGL